MKELLQLMFNYLKRTIFISLIDLTVILGPLLLLSLIMNFISARLNNLLLQLFGRKSYMNLLARPGVFTHELGHYLFCIIFRHQVTEVKFFDNSEQATHLGYVKHRYDANSIYQRLGNFFISLETILFNSILLYGLLYIFLDMNILNAIDKIDLNLLQNYKQPALIIQDLTDYFCLLIDFLKQIFLTNGLVWWQLLLLIYSLYAIGSFITLSQADLKGATEGLKVIFGLIVIINFISSLLHDFFSLNIYLSDLFQIIAPFSEKFLLLMSINIFVNVVLLLFVYILKLIVIRIR